MDIRSKQIATITLTVEELDRLISILDQRYHRDSDIKYLLKKIYSQHPIDPLPFSNTDDGLFARSKFK